MEETTSVFWVNLGYKLRSRLRVPLQDSWGMTDILSVYCFIVFTVSTVTVTVTVLAGGIAWFNARHLGCGLGYVRDPPKVWTISFLSISITYDLD